MPDGGYDFKRSAGTRRADVSDVWREQYAVALAASAADVYR